MARLRIILLLSFCLMATPISADESGSITVSGTQLTGLLDARHPGPYNEIFHLLTEDYPYPVFLTVAPMRRANRFFAQRRADCHFVGSDSYDYYETLGVRADQIIISDSIYTVRVDLYSAKGTRPIESTEDITGQIIGMYSGAGNVVFIAKLMGHSPDDILMVQNLEQGFQMLDKGRIGALVAVDLDVKYLQSQDARYFGYSVSDTFTLRKSGDTIVCRRLSHTVPFMDHVNRRLATIKAAGTFEKILSKAFLSAAPMKAPDR